MFRHYYIQHVKEGMQIRVYKINKEIVKHSSQFILVNPKESLKKCARNPKKYCFTRSIDVNINTKYLNTLTNMDNDF